MQLVMPCKSGLAEPSPRMKNINCHALRNWIGNCGSSAHFSSYPILTATACGTSPPAMLDTRVRRNVRLDIRTTALYTVMVRKDQKVKKDLTAIRLRPEQVAGLRKLIPADDKETTISMLIRRAVDEFLARQKGGRK